MTAMILRINVSGQAIDWIDWQEAVLLYAKDKVVWTLGDTSVRYYGGMNKVRNSRSFVDVHSIVAAKGVIGRTKYKTIPSLTNRELFRRDSHTCMYCLTSMSDRHLTRDHIIPLSRGGQDEWTNVVTACRSCNGRKVDKLLSDISMHLHAFTCNSIYT